MTSMTGATLMTMLPSRTSPRSHKWSAKLSYLRTMPEMNPRHKREERDLLRDPITGAVDLPRRRILRQLGPGGLE